MKKITRILSAALVAMMVLSLAIVASAETPSVFIPGRLAKLVDSVVDDYVFPELVTKGDTIGRPGFEKLNTEGVMHFQFSEKPDWFGASVSSLNGNWINIDVDESGYAEMELEDLVRQPGMWSWSSVTFVNKEGKFIPTAFTPRNDKYVEKHFQGEGYDDFVVTPAKFTTDDGEYWIMYFGNGGDYPYTAGKDYGNYNVTVKYHRDGSAYEVAVSLKDTDLFETGIDGAVTTITFKLVNVELDSYRKLYLAELDEDGDIVLDENGRPVWQRKVTPNNKFVKTTRDPKTGEIIKVTYQDIDWDAYDLSNTDMWYVASVSAAYPVGNPIVGVEADYRNDAKNNLSQYKITYPVNDTDVVRITYKPNNTAVFGEYLKNDSVYAVSGSGNNLNKWYRNFGSATNVKIPVYKKNADGTYSIDHYTTEAKLQKNGKQVKTIKKGIGSYKSPRVTTK